MRSLDGRGERENRGLGSRVARAGYGVQGWVGAPRLAPGSHYVARLRGLWFYLGAHRRVGTLGYFMPPAFAGLGIGEGDGLPRAYATGLSSCARFAGCSGRELCPTVTLGRTRALYVMWGG